MRIIYTLDFILKNEKNRLALQDLLVANTYFYKVAQQRYNTRLAIALPGIVKSKYFTNSGSSTLDSITVSYSDKNDNIREETTGNISAAVLL